MNESWAYVESVHGIRFHIKFDDEKIYEITGREPQFAMFSELPEKYQYLEKYLADHTGQPMLIEALEDLDFSWVTPFQLSVYRALATIPSGTLISYGELASIAGSPRAARAVGSVMSKNRFICVIPCHRVIASDGSIGGFTGGLELKRELLKPEGIYI